jgi:sulfite oxidase
VLAPNIKNLKDADFSKVKAIQETPVQSAICEPIDGASVSKSSEKLIIKGYAFSGGGDSIDSVKVSIDGGKNWQTAKLKHFKNQPLYRYNSNEIYIKRKVSMLKVYIANNHLNCRNWAWSIWQVDVNIPRDQDMLEIVCVASDSSNNTQPESSKSIWNARGLLNNEWHKIKINLKD